MTADERRSDEVTVKPSSVRREWAIHPRDFEVRMMMAMCDSGKAHIEPTDPDDGVGVAWIRVMDAASAGAQFMREVMNDRLAAAMTRRQLCVECNDGEHNPTLAGWCNNCECHGDCVLVEHIAQALYQHDRDPDYSGAEWDWPNIDRSYDYEGEGEPGPEWLRDLIRAQARVALAAALETSGAWDNSCAPGDSIRAECPHGWTRAHWHTPTNPRQLADPRELADFPGGYYGYQCPGPRPAADERER